jgi:hypothetical protein
MAIPGRVLTETRMVKSSKESSGRGRVVICKTSRCGPLEIIEHR